MLVRPIESPIKAILNFLVQVDLVAGERIIIINYTHAYHLITSGIFFFFGRT